MTVATKVKGDLSHDAIIMLNKINADMLSQMFEEKVPSIADTKMVDGLYRCYRPAYQDYVELSQKEFTNAIRCVAFSTLNQIAYQNITQAYLLGFSNEQVKASADNYGKEKRGASVAVYQLLD